jgi:hypothetical protein
MGEPPHNKEEQTMIDVKSTLEKHSKCLRGEEGGERADLVGADLGGADLSGADLRGANMRRADLRNANLRGANLRGAALFSAYLHGADLRSTDLYGTNLREADLSKADLSDANLHGADLSWADLSGAILHRAILNDANLSGISLGGAYLDDTKLPIGVRIISVSGVGSTRRMTTFRVDTDEVWCGCFKGTLKKFAEAIEETHRWNAMHLADYRNVVAMLESFRKNNKAGFCERSAQ